MLRRDVVAEAHGFTLVELLVTITLLSVVGAVTVTGLVRSFAAVDTAEQRIEAFSELQITLERTARELRAADPILPGFTQTQASMHVRRNGVCTRFDLGLSGGVLTLGRAVSTDDCVTFAAATTQVLATDVSGTTDDRVFGPGVGSAMLAYADADGNVTTDAIAVRTIRFSLQRQIPDQPTVVVSTVVNVRNNRGVQP